MIFPEYESFDGIGLADLVKRGVISPAELLEVAIDRIEEKNPALNAVIYKMYDEAKAQLRGNIPPGPFQGVPFLLKDLLTEYAGVPLSSGSRFTQHWIPEQDNELVKRIKQAGLIVLGKTNVPEFGLSSVTEPALFGPTRNPWDHTRSSGGSSGGAAAAVASGMVPMAHANDGAGSIRIPAAYCGLLGFKPSRGRTPTSSVMMRLWENLVVEHVITRSVRDSAAMLDVLAGPEIGSTISLAAPQSSYLDCLTKPFRQLRIAVTDKAFFPSVVSEEIIVGTQNAAELCRDLGHLVSPVSLSIDSADVALAYVIVTAGEMAACIKRFSEKMGSKPKHHDLETQTSVLCHIGDNISAADYAWASGVLDNAARHLAKFFLDYDVLLTPTMNATAPKIGEFAPTPFELNMLELLARMPLAPLLKKAMEHAAAKNFANFPFTPIFNISGQPAMSVPLFFDSLGLPMGMQFAARVGDEETLFQLAFQLEQACPWVGQKCSDKL